MTFRPHVGERSKNVIKYQFQAQFNLIATKLIGKR